MAATIHSPRPQKSLPLEIPFLGAGAAPMTMWAQRWDGNERTVTEWNSLRRDDELWLEGGECYVYLYQPGQSQRGPSFRIPYELLVKANCNDLLDHHLISTWNSSPYSPSCPGGECYLYLHAPANLSREDAFNYHLDTRNFFAWMVGIPLVGADPISSLIRLKDRMDIWRDRTSDNLGDLIAYIKIQGYCDVPESLEVPVVEKPVEPQRQPRGKFESLKRMFKIPAPTKRMSVMLSGTPRRTDQTRPLTSIFSAMQSTSEFSQCQSCSQEQHVHDDESLPEDDRMSSESSYSGPSTPPPLSPSRKESMSSSTSSAPSVRTSSPSTPQTPEFARHSESSGLGINMGRGDESTNQLQEEKRNSPQEQVIHDLMAELRYGSDDF